MLLATLALAEPSYPIVSEKNIRETTIDHDRREQVNVVGGALEKGVRRGERLDFGASNRFAARIGEEREGSLLEVAKSGIRGWRSCSVNGGVGLPAEHRLLDRGVTDLREQAARRRLGKRDGRTGERATRVEGLPQRFGKVGNGAHGPRSVTVAADHSSRAETLSPGLVGNDSR